MFGGRPCGSLGQGQNGWKDVACGVITWLCPSPTGEQGLSHPGAGKSSSSCFKWTKQWLQLSDEPEGQPSAP